jgi:hypothetical protein
MGLRPPPDAPARFLPRLGLAALAALAAWWILREPFAAAFRAAWNLAFAAAGLGRAWRLVPARGAEAVGVDTLIWLVGPTGTAGITIRFPTLWHAYVPLAIFAGLAFAAGHLRAGQARRLLAGGGVVTGYTALSLVITAAFFGLREPSLGWRASEATTAAVDLAYRLLAYPVGLEYVVPAVAWYALLGTRPAEAPARRRGLAG